MYHDGTRGTAKDAFSCQCIKAVLSSTYQFSLVRLQSIRVLFEALKELGCTSRLDSRQSIYISHSLQSFQHFRRRSASTIAVSFASNDGQQEKKKCQMQQPSQHTHTPTNSHWNFPCRDGFWHCNIIHVKKAHIHTHGICKKKKTYHL